MSVGQSYLEYYTAVKTDQLEQHGPTWVSLPSMAVNSGSPRSSTLCKMKTGRPHSRTLKKMNAECNGGSSGGPGGFNSSVMVYLLGWW